MGLLPCSKLNSLYSLSQITFIMPYKLAMTILSLWIRKRRLGRLSQLSKGHNKEGTRHGFYCFMAVAEETGLELLFFFLSSPENAPLYHNRV